jgi:hypothetical protein
MDDDISFEREAAEQILSFARCHRQDESQA